MGVREVEVAARVRRIRHLEPGTQVSWGGGILGPPDAEARAKGHGQQSGTGGGTGAHPCTRGHSGDQPGEAKLERDLLLGDDPHRCSGTAPWCPVDTMTLGVRPGLPQPVSSGCYDAAPPAGGRLAQHWGIGARQAPGHSSLSTAGQGGPQALTERDRDGCRAIYVPQGTSS